VLCPEASADLLDEFVCAVVVEVVEAIGESGGGEEPDDWLVSTLSTDDEDEDSDVPSSAGGSAA
jgi:hypothetical protein